MIRGSVPLHRTAIGCSCDTTSVRRRSNALRSSTYMHINLLEINQPQLQCYSYHANCNVHFLTSNHAPALNLPCMRHWPLYKGRNKFGIGSEYDNIISNPY